MERTIRQNSHVSQIISELSCLEVIHSSRNSRQKPWVNHFSLMVKGRLALPGGTLTSDFVEFEVKRALEWLQGLDHKDALTLLGDRNEQRRYAAVLVLKELALNSATLIYSYVPQILDLIWIPLRDTKVHSLETQPLGLDSRRRCRSLARLSQTHSGERKPDT